MLGFLPGFAYMGEVDERIAAPRKTSPRLKVPKGSVGIAGRQTGIYSLESPGGWQIIGRTNVALFTPERDAPTFLKAGDNVKFYKAIFWFAGVMVFIHESSGNELKLKLFSSQLTSFPIHQHSADAEFETRILPPLRHSAVGHQLVSIGWRAFA